MLSRREGREGGHRVEIIIERPEMKGLGKSLRLGVETTSSRNTLSTARQEQDREGGRCLLPQRTQHVGAAERMVLGAAHKRLSAIAVGGRRTRYGESNIYSPFVMHPI